MLLEHLAIVLIYLHSWPRFLSYLSLKQNTYTIPERQLPIRFSVSHHPPPSPFQPARRWSTCVSVVPMPFKFRYFPKEPISHPCSWPRGKKTFSFHKSHSDFFQRTGVYQSHRHWQLLSVSWHSTAWWVNRAILKEFLPADIHLVTYRWRPSACL